MQVTENQENNLLQCFTELSYTKECLKVNTCLPGWFGVHYIRVFCKFHDDPYYELLPWFMIIWRSGYGQFLQANENQETIVYCLYVLIAMF